MRWDDVIDSLAFSPDGGTTECVMHRRAFRTLLGREPSQADCVALFTTCRAGFEAAALGKRERAGLGPGARYHINSRDVRRALSGLSAVRAEAAQKEPGQGAQQGP